MSKRKLSPRAKFIAEADLKKLAGWSWDAMKLASTHDPDHSKKLIELDKMCGYLFNQTLELEQRIRKLGVLQETRFTDTCVRLSKLE